MAIVELQLSFLAVNPHDFIPYAEALHLLRYYLRCPWSKTPVDLPMLSYTLHSLKSTFLTFLACSSQLPSEITPEERHMQGHHAMPQSSMRRYSRDDVFLQLQLQRTIRSKVLAGWRPETAQHRGGQTPLQELTVQVERFRKQSPQYEWKRFVFHGSQTPDVLSLESSQHSALKIDTKNGGFGKGNFFKW